jgi:hypothetical protein
MEAALAHLCSGGERGTFIDCCGNPTVHAAAVKLGLTPINLVVWAKTDAGMGSLAARVAALVQEGDARHVNNVQLGKKGRWRSNVRTYPDVPSPTPRAAYRQSSYWRGASRQGCPSERRLFANPRRCRRSRFKSAT